MHVTYQICMVALKCVLVQRPQICLINAAFICYALLDCSRKTVHGVSSSYDTWCLVRPPSWGGPMFSGGLAILQDLLNKARPPKNILNKNFKVFRTNVKKSWKSPLTMNVWTVCSKTFAKILSRPNRIT